MDSYLLRYNSFRMLYAFHYKVCDVYFHGERNRYFWDGLLSQFSWKNSPKAISLKRNFSKRFTSLQPIFFCQTLLNNLDGKYNVYCDLWNHCQCTVESVEQNQKSWGRIRSPLGLPYAVVSVISTSLHCFVYQRVQSHFNFSQI